MNKLFGSAQVTARVLFIVLGGGLIVAAIIALLVQQLPEQRAAQNRSPLADFLSSDTQREFAEVTSEYRLRFPEDHGAHPDFRQEWWYFTGNLLGDDQREYGFQLTFFRFAHASSENLPPTGWNNDQTWMAHFAFSDFQQDVFYAEEDFARGAIDLAGATSDPFAVWINGWSVSQGPASCQNCLSARLEAQMEGVSIDLVVRSTRGPVLQGDRGFSVKNQKGDVASYYYSYPDLETSGTVQVGGRSLAVKGQTWMDREWSSAVLAKGQSGWDWFALHLEDGRKLMLFQVRDEINGHFRHAVLIDRKGNKAQIDTSDLELIPTDYWNSPQTGYRYPLEWIIKNKSDNNRLNIKIQPKIENQELDLSFQYYEGAVEVEGEIGGKEVAGNGYMELTGYER